MYTHIHIRIHTQHSTSRHLAGLHAGGGARAVGEVRHDPRPDTLYMSCVCMCVCIYIYVYVCIYYVSLSISLSIYIYI